jgi:hypothetical protein
MCLLLALVLVIGSLLVLLRCSFSSCVVTLPWSSSFDLSWTLLGVCYPHLFSFCPALGPWVVAGLVQVFLLLMCCHFALTLVLGSFLDLLSLSFSSWVLTLPCSCSFDLSFACLGVPSPHVLSLCLPLGPWIFAGPAQFILLVMSSYFVLLLLL